jgi:hypothetical protein
MNKLFYVLPAACLGLMLTVGPARAQVSVTTYHNNNHRDGANLNEAILTPANVNSTTFGR